MKLGWKKYLLYASIVIVGGVLFFIFIQTVRAKNTGFEVKTLWDWMDLLIVPLVLAGGALYLNRSERNNEREIATDRQQEAALQAYLDRMSDLLLKENLRNSEENEEVRKVARTRTLAVLRGLDAIRKGFVVSFLQEAGLISRITTFVDLNDADLSGVNLRYAKLNGVNLRGANLRGVNLSKAKLSGADLGSADLTYANLRGAKLSGADLSGANLSHANLHNTSVSEEQLATAISLKGVTMPDGTIHE